jgi:hypothetical protein
MAGARRARGGGGLVSWDPLCYSRL